MWRNVSLVDCVWIVDIMLNERRAGKVTKKGGMDATVGGGPVMDLKAGMVSTALSGSIAGEVDRSICNVAGQVQLERVLEKDLEKPIEIQSGMLLIIRGWSVG